MVKENSMAKTIYMEDVRSIGLEAMALIEKRLLEFGIELKDGQDDLIYVPMEEAIEKIAGSPDYASHN
jgi:hypothetical protein